MSAGEIYYSGLAELGGMPDARFSYAHVRVRIDPPTALHPLTLDCPDVAKSIPRLNTELRGDPTRHLMGICSLTHVPYLGSAINRAQQFLKAADPP